MLKDPQERLEQLRRSSLLEFEHLKSPEHPEPPRRALPAHSVPGPGAYDGVDTPQDLKGEGNGKEGDNGGRKESATAAARVVYGLDGADERDAETGKESGGNGERERGRPVFKDLDFGSGGLAAAQAVWHGLGEEVVSPSEVEREGYEASTGLGAATTSAEEK